ncbi:PorT family protein [Hymenobacter sp. BT18]|uniref:porin family protein n=1 Tax=Hymenobacter sp. BT18 TaxID=2835648 RepID=UPI00143E54B8|nr:porin family protein [Hymenobacter sp. BT18]QIX62757.1 PorT family protein [Hymenobacter sp. BT18]
MKYILLLGLVIASLSVSYGQVSVSVGPRVGLNAATGKYTNNWQYATEYLLRGEAGVTANVGWQHWALQASVLYAQKGYRINDDHTFSDGRQWITQHTSQLNYLTLPMNVAFSLKPDGQGLQVFAGGYVGKLVNGHSSYDVRLELDQEVFEAHGEKDIEPGDAYKLGPKNQSKGLDAGLQAGVGYRYNNLLVQAGYSVGLVDLEPSSKLIVPYDIVKATYYNRVGQVSIAYFLKLK